METCTPLRRDRNQEAHSAMGCSPCLSRGRSQMMAYHAATTCGGDVGRAGININENASGEAAPLAANQLAVYHALRLVHVFLRAATEHRRLSPSPE